MSGIPGVSGIFGTALGAILAAVGWTRTGTVISPTVPTDTVQIGGLLTTAGRQIGTVVTSSTPYAILVTDDFVGINATGGNKVANLPAAVTGRRLTVMNVALAAVVNTVSVTPNGAETINGIAAATLLTGTQSVTLVGLTGTGWFVI